jgi:murein DD-endopeptidase MepM/ murein hydrolase activator NlpD
MRLRRRYSFLYIPEGDGQSREFRVSIASVVLAAGGLLVLLLAAGLYAVDWSVGAAWRPGGSPLALENGRLQGEVDRFGSRVAALQQDLDRVFAYQQLVAAAVDVQPLDPGARAGGIGGRVPLHVVGELDGVSGGSDLESLLHQARIQHRGMVALLDSLEARQEVRDRIPSIRPCDIGWVSSRFGMRRDPFTNKHTFHRGIDFSLPKGTPVRVTADGVVESVEKQRGLGRLVKVDHGNGVVTVYAHLQESRVEPGQQVRRGEVIALSGNSGRSTAPHLHYEERVGDRAVNPLSYILDSYADVR